MRIVIQNPQTGCYFEETGGWTTDVKLARDFVSSADALSARQQHCLSEASLVFRFEREGYSITVPLESLPQTQADFPFDSEHPTRHEADLLIS